MGCGRYRQRGPALSKVGISNEHCICFTREGLEPLPVFLKPHCYSGDKYSNKKKSDKIGVRYGFSSIYLSQV